MNVLAFAYSENVSFTPPGADDAVQINQIIVDGVTSYSFGEGGAVTMVTALGSAIAPAGFVSFRVLPSLARGVPPTAPREDPA